jgi:alpha-glucosidase (family GH31 glycosyl hydrolase)
MRLVLVAALAAVTFACAPPTPTFSGQKLTTKDTHVVISDALGTWFETYAGGDGAYAPVAVRSAKARYEMQYGSWRITDAQGDWSQGTRFSWDNVKDTEARGTYRDATGKVIVTLDATSDAAGAIKLVYTAADTSVDRISAAFACADGEHFLGFGGQQDAVDHRGHTIPIWTSEPGIGKNITDDSTPALWMLEGTRHASSYGLGTWHSSRGYIGAVPSDRRAIFEMCSTRSDAWRVEVWDHTLTLWLFRGNTVFAPLTQATTTVLGRPMQPPLVAFAPWNDAIFGTANVKAVAKELRDNEIPSSVLWSEDFRGGAFNSAGDAYRLRENWDLDSTLYPDAGAAADELAHQGFAWLAYFNSFIVQGQPIFDEATQGGHFVKDATGAPYLFSGPTFQPTGLADLSRPETREWVKSHMRKALAQGFTGWMADFGEWLPHDAVLASGEDALAAHNRYALEWAKVSKEVLDERVNDGVTRVTFSRSGWFQSNAVTPVVWGGDQRTDFEPDDGLPTQVPYAINLGLAGVSTFGSDIGGYQTATNAPTTKEVYFRWVELGALSPVMRTHHTTDPNHSWHFDSDAETLAHYKRWAQFHMQLVPYLDGESAVAETVGLPLVRALPLIFPDDATSWTVSDEYLLGGELLVAPITTQGATSRDVYVPPGSWVALDGSQTVTGPTTVTVQAPLSEIPVFVHQGSIIPRYPVRVMTVLPSTTTPSGPTLAERRLLIAPGAAGSFVERDGTTYDLTTSTYTGYREQGVELADCAKPTDRGCVDRSGKNPVVRMSTQGPIEVAGGFLQIAGTTHTWDVEVVKSP